MSGSALECVSSHKYLAIVTFADLTWANHIKGITTNTTKQIGLLYHRFYEHVQQEILRALYVALTRPHLENGISVWDPHLLKDNNVLAEV